MIHIDRLPKPVELTDDVVSNKIALFKATKKAVWKEPYITDTLLKMSYGKCCYCECNVTAESNYMEVEHFNDKSTYPDRVVDWNNLLPSCKKCNCSKSTHDTVVEPIINPCNDNPNDHMYLYNGVLYKGLDDLGNATIDVLHLNDQKRHCTPRFQYGTEIELKMEGLLNRTIECLSNGQWSNQKKSNLRNKVKSLFEKGEKDQAYSAVAATWIINSPNYISLKTNLQKIGIWTNEMVDLEADLTAIAYRLS
jgi:uncharacterized protein (TIGR02646 family)